MTESNKINENEFNQKIEHAKMNNPELYYSEVIALVVEEHEIDLNDINKLISKTLREKLYHELSTRRMIDRDKAITSTIMLDI